jgi:hypothetical protein
VGNSFILACTSLLFSINTYAETFSTSINNNCKVHNQFPVSGETIEYEGECKEGFASGIGKVKWYANGKLHQISGGNYIKGKLEGECNIQVVNSKHSFTGACKDDAPSNGTYTYEDGSVYVGEFEYGKPKGKATRK